MNDQTQKAQDLNKDDQYIKAFNHGYILHQENPELLEKLKQVDGLDPEYIKGLDHGQEQFKIEQYLDKMVKEEREDIQQTYHDSKDKGIDRETKDHDDPELDY